ncbi:hypothetical protein [Streptomyces sp. H27-H5]|uniref:hypothetical protein n=1 Tax=Streptomyces sp. H27-H5 TaxID=2996460 RepID=UPI00226F0B4F|nr:hypothetical protein [Streptomyces sp. H27-H5]MCY0959057.1 hypothetical protein [Streptomyces sp. H27-H5]
MPSYSEIVQTDLSALTTAADGWKAMATQFKTMEDVYKDEVQSVSAGNGWMGSSAQTAATNAGMTRGEFASAQKEALAMESLLRDAHTRFTDLKGRVKSAVADAEAAGMKVSDQGIASYDFAKVSGDTAKAIRHDPDLPEVERSWTRRIGDAVKAVTEFDADVKTALLNASGADGTAMFGFNSKPVGDVEAVEALALTSKVRDGKASPEELRHYNEILKQNGDDKHFSEAYLHALGAKDTLDLADRMNLAANDRGASAADKKLYESINAGLASTVASGTKDPGSYAYKPFVDGLKEQGPELVGKGLPTHGYQALVTLMANGDGYGKQFLNDLGDGMIEAEKSKPHMYDHAYDPKRPNLVSDPLDGLLGIMAKDPDSATYFLDPDAAGNKNEHLKYLLKDRDMPDPWIATAVGPPMEMHGDKTAGLGAAIQAAATGHVDGEKLGPPGPHTEGQARVMHNAIRLLDGGMEGDEFPEHLEGLRQPMGKALVDYVADTHEILGGKNSDLGMVSGSDSIHGSGDKAQIAVGQGSLIRVMRGISDDGASYGLMVQAERVYSAEQLAMAAPYKADSPHAVSADWDNRAHDVGVATGALNGIGADVYKDKEDDKGEWAEGTSEYTAATVNGLIGEIPVVSTIGGSLIDAAKYDWVQGVKDAAEEQSKQESSTNYAGGMEGTNKLFDVWREQRQIDADDPAAEHAQNEAGNAYSAGREAARAHLRP